MSNRGMALPLSPHRGRRGPGGRTGGGDRSGGERCRRRSVVLHGHGADGDADVPAVDIANELDAVVVALPVLHEPIKIPRHSIILAEREGTGSVWVSCVSLQCNSMNQPALKEQLGKEDLELHQVEKKPRKT